MLCQLVGPTVEQQHWWRHLGSGTGPCRPHPNFDLLLLSVESSTLHPLLPSPCPHPRWVTTPQYDPSNRRHVEIVDEIIIGNGLPVSRVLCQALGRRRLASKQGWPGLHCCRSTFFPVSSAHSHSSASLALPLKLKALALCPCLRSAPTRGVRPRRPASLWASSFWTAVTWRRPPPPPPSHGEGGHATGRLAGHGGVALWCCTWVGQSGVGMCAAHALQSSRYVVASSVLSSRHPHPPGTCGWAAMCGCCAGSGPSTAPL